MRVLIAVLALTSAGPVLAKDISFTNAPTQVCLAGADGVDRIACIGASANLCMETPSGGSTVGMGYCLGQELGFWDDRLNAAYAELRRTERGIMEDAEASNIRVPDSVSALRDMQRAWMGYRDATCIYEYSTWGGGTGGGPANAACLLDLTGQQALRLEDRLQERRR